MAAVVVGTGHDQTFDHESDRVPNPWGIPLTNGRRGRIGSTVPDRPFRASVVRGLLRFEPSLADRPQWFRSTL